ncbi:MAG: hypothetical protein E6R08_07630 [Nevskiaceae bacterium]|jgi:hypothetical protein|nr:MAG: hypothetical protein EKK33_05910 [Bradyrhizobiaceae bacterium]TXG97163.1 MAG: hypothetical protein E6R08_07630 [Nevskiaceae bacterium]
MAEEKSTKQETRSSRTRGTLASGVTIKLPHLTQDQKQYLNRIQSSEQNPDLDIPLGGPGVPTW